MTHRKRQRPRSTSRSKLVSRVAVTDICAQLGLDWETRQMLLAELSTPSCIRVALRDGLARDSHIPESARRTLLEITRGRRILSLRRFATLAGYTAVNESDFRDRIQSLAKAGRLEVQQSGYLGDSEHHQRLVKILEDALW